jgi:hypothetical protein
MKIVNPLYDKAFKYLMENNRLAKKVLSVLLDVEVVELSVGQQETHVPLLTRQLTLFRLDFKATIVEADGSRKTVLIELQKSRSPIDIRRFRNYLGAQYLSNPLQPGSDVQEQVVTEPVEPYESIYPIITIYILGYNLDDLPYLAVTVNRDIINSVNKEKIEVKSFFIDHLTHQSHILQVRRLPEQRRSRLEQFLILFNQAWCTEHEYILDLQDVPDEFADIADYLSGPAHDKKFRAQLEGEWEIEYLFEYHEAKFLKQIEEERRLKEEERQQKEEERQQKEEERRLKEEERRLKEEERRQKESALARISKLEQLLKKQGLSSDDIAKETGLDV